MGMELSDQKKGYKADYGRGSFPTCKKYEQERMTTVTLGNLKVIEIEILLTLLIHIGNL